MVSFLDKVEMFYGVIVLRFELFLDEVYSMRTKGAKDSKPRKLRGSKKAKVAVVESPVVALDAAKVEPGSPETSLGVTESH